MARMQKAIKAEARLFIRALSFYEDELIASIQRANSILLLTRETCEAGLIPQEVKNQCTTCTPINVQVSNVACT